MINNINIDKVVQENIIEKNKHKYYKLKNEYEDLPDRIKSAEYNYYKEGGCNLNDPSDKKRCGLEYYLEIKRGERKKALESFKNKEKQNNSEAEEITNFSFFDNFKFTNIFNKKIEGMETLMDDTNNKAIGCSWNNNKSVFGKCANENYDANNFAPCKYNKELDNLIVDLSTHRTSLNALKEQNTTNKAILTSGGNNPLKNKALHDEERQLKVDIRHATFYDKSTDDYKNTIGILHVLYWIVLAVLVFIFIYKRFYQIDRYGYIVILTFLLVPIYLLNFLINIVMLNVKRFHFIDTLYFTIALITVITASFLYFITSQ